LSGIFIVAFFYFGDICYQADRNNRFYLCPVVFCCVFCLRTTGCLAAQKMRFV
jgi:hypothetical protein